jgi:hypothetical protein
MGDDTKRSRHIQFRLHPDIEEEAKVLELLDYWNKEGYSNRQIFTDAVLRSQGYTPEMFGQGGDGLTIPMLLHRIEETVANAIKEVIDNLPAPAKKKALEEAEVDDSEAYARNLAKSYMSRSGGKK